MPRKREGEVRESLTHLEQLETQYKGKPQELRIKAIRLLKERPTLRLEDVGDLIGVSGKTVKRWWRLYRVSGLNELRKLSATPRAPRSVDENLLNLKHKLLAGDFSDLAEVREWLEESVVLDTGSRVAPSPANIHETRAIRKFISFLNRLPTLFAIDQWTISFRDVLQDFLGDVDRIMVGLNTHSILFGTEQNLGNTIITQQIENNSSVVLVTGERDMKPVERQLEVLRQRNFPFAEYYPPRGYTYYYGDTAYVGSVLLWRLRGRPQLSERTLRLMDELEPFFVFLFTDAIVRHRLAHPTDLVFDESINRVTQVVGLTPSEKRVLILQLLGMSYEEMASNLGISLNTVRYHLKSIYKKTDTHSLSELYAKYFTPRIETQKAHS